MGSIVAATQDLAALLVAAGVAATADPAAAAAARAVVYVEPPRIDYTTKSEAWQLVAVTNQPAGTLAALSELDALVQAVLATTLPIETATPTTYTLTLDRPPYPAYVMTLTR